MDKGDKFVNLKEFVNRTTPSLELQVIRYAYWHLTVSMLIFKRLCYANLASIRNLLSKIVNLLALIVITDTRVNAGHLPCDVHFLPTKRQTRDRPHTVHGRSSSEQENCLKI